IYRRVVERRQYTDGVSLDKRITISRLPNATGNSAISVETYDVEQRLTKEIHYFSGNPVITGCLSGTWDDGKEYMTEFYDANGTTLLRREKRKWEQDNFSFWYCDGASEAPNNPRVTEIETELVDSNQVSKTTFIYDTYGNTTD